MKAFSLVFWAKNETFFFQNSVALFFTILVIVPTTIIREMNTFVENEHTTNPTDCTYVINNIQKSPKFIYDTKLLGKCEYTQPLSKIIPVEKSGKNDSQDMLNETI